MSVNGALTRVLHACVKKKHFPTSVCLYVPTENIMTFEEACGSKSMKKCGKANISHELINIFSIFLVLWSGKFTVGYIEYRRFPIILYFSLGFPSNIHRKQKDFFFNFL